MGYSKHIHMELEKYIFLSSDRSSTTSRSAHHTSSLHSHTFPIHYHHSTPYFAFPYHCTNTYSSVLQNSAHFRPVQNVPIQMDSRNDFPTKVLSYVSPVNCQRTQQQGFRCLRTHK